MKKREYLYNETIKTPPLRLEGVPDRAGALKSARLIITPECENCFEDINAPAAFSGTPSYPRGGSTVANLP